MAKIDIKPLFQRLNGYCTRALEGAAGLCISRGHYEVSVEHVLLKMLEDPAGDPALILLHFDADVAKLQRSLQRAVEGFRSGNAGKPVFSPVLVEWIKDGWLVASVEWSLPEIRSAALVAVLVSDPGRYLADDHPELDKVRAEELRRSHADIVAGSPEETTLRRDVPAAGPASAGAVPGAPGGALARFATNFTAAARAGKVDPVFGRDREIRQAIDILARRRKNNPIVVGEAGVGKTAIVEGLALRVAEGDVPDFLKGVDIWGLDMGLLQAGAGVKGEFESRLKGVIDEVKANTKGIILFIDEAHTLVGAGGAAGMGDAANLLKPALARGEMRTIGATTWMEYKKYFEEDPALARRFQPVKVDEPSAADAAIMLRGLKEKYEKFYEGIEVRDDAVEAAAKLSSRYIAGRQLPDKAVDLLDTSAARVKIGLTTKPGFIEDLERRIQAMEREAAAIERDRDGGTAVDEGHASGLAADLERVRAELATKESAWRKERDAVERVIGLRKRIVAAKKEAPTAAPVPDGAPPSAAPAFLDDLKRDLRTALGELDAIQGKNPVVHLDVSPEVVASVVENWTGIPVGKMVGDEATMVLTLGRRLKERIKGQDHAIGGISEGLKAAKAGVHDPNKPMGVFLLAGPSGVGKTETALAVADLLFGGEKFMVTINMSEYQDREMGVSGLVGAKPGYVGYGKGGTLTEAVRQRPYTVVLLDEIEKACQEVRNLFFQVFDKGDLTDGTGRSIDFKNTVIFIATNLASDVIQQMCAAGPSPDLKEILDGIRPVLSRALQPAWLARTTVIPYLSLGPDALREIAKLKVGKIGKRLAESHRMAFEHDPKVIDLIVDRCTEVETGARNIDYILQGSLLPRISTELLTRMAEGAVPERLRLGVGPDAEFTLDFSGAGIAAPR
ncbi:MAG: type VI secretion system ATPase TssH [Acidobacteriia bacterium]|nr:type VI secretion system ATPase TssH [Terriglobia bacterium]